MKNPLGLSIGLFSLLLFSVVKKIHFHATSYFDLGIYTDALRLITFDNLNPFVPGRAINILNDHFDPILIPVSFIGKFINPGYLGLSLEFISIGLCWIPFQKLSKAGFLDKTASTFCFIALILNHAVIDAVYTPFHPTTWAALPMVFVLTEYLLKNYRSLLFWMVLLMACREEFPLMGLTTSIAVILFDRKFAWGAFLLLITGAWSVFTFMIRPKIFQGFHSTYGGDLIRSFFESPLSLLRNNLDFGTIKLFFIRSFPLLIFLDFQKIRNGLSHIGAILFITSPLIGIRLISSKWGFHYGTAAVIALIFALIPFLRRIDFHSTRFKLTFALMIVVFISPVSKNIIGGTDKRFPNSDKRIEEINIAQKKLTTGNYRKILAENNLASTYSLKARADQEVYLLGGPHSPSMNPFDAVLLEKPTSGDAWPLTAKDIESLIQKLRSDENVNILTDNEWVFLAEGKIQYP